MKYDKSFKGDVREKIDSDELLNVLNEKYFEIISDEIKKQGKDLVVIIDHLDRIDNSDKTELYLKLAMHLKLNCHLVITVPLSYIYNQKHDDFISNVKLLSLIPVKTREGDPFVMSVNLLKQLVMARAFPNLNKKDQLNRVKMLFENSVILDRICMVSGGHLRNLIHFMHRLIMKSDLPFSASLVEEVIAEYQNTLARAISRDEWNILSNLRKYPDNNSEIEYKKLISKSIAYEYYDGHGTWLDANPLLFEFIGKIG